MTSAAGVHVIFTAGAPWRSRRVPPNKRLKLAGAPNKVDFHLCATLVTVAQRANGAAAGFAPAA